MWVDFYKRMWHQFSYEGGLSSRAEPNQYITQSGLIFGKHASDAPLGLWLTKWWKKSKISSLLTLVQIDEIKFGLLCIQLIFPIWHAATTTCFQIWKKWLDGQIAYFMLIMVEQKKKPNTCMLSSLSGSVLLTPSSHTSSFFLTQYGNVWWIQ